MRGFECGLCHWIARWLAAFTKWCAKRETSADPSVGGSLHPITETTAQDLLIWFTGDFGGSAAGMPPEGLPLVTMLAESHEKVRLVEVRTFPSGNYHSIHVSGPGSMDLFENIFRYCEKAGVIPFARPNTPDYRLNWFRDAAALEVSRCCR